MILPLFSCLALLVSEGEESNMSFVSLIFIIPRCHVDSTTVCYDDLGCINKFSFADPLLWPIDLLPESRTKINTYFTLYTREMPFIPPVKIIFYPMRLFLISFSKF